MTALGETQADAVPVVESDPRPPGGFDPRPPGGFDPGRDHLLARLARTGGRLRFAVEHHPQQVLAGAVIDVPGSNDALLAAEASADAAEAAGYRIRLRALARAFGLTDLDLELLLTALLVEVHPDIETLLATVSNDRSRLRPTVALALTLAGFSPADPAARERLMPGKPLLAGGLLELLNPDRPFPTRALRLPDRVAMHLLGGDVPDPALAELIAVPHPDLSVPEQTRAGTAALQAGAMLGYVREKPGGDGLSQAANALAGWGATSLALLLPGSASRLPADLTDLALREARLRGAALVIGPVESLIGPERLGALARLCDSSWPVILFGRTGWDPGWSGRVPFQLEAPPPAARRIAQVLSGLLDTRRDPELDLAEITATLRVDPQRIEQVATAAWLRTAGTHRLVQRDDARAGIRTQNGAGLERLAQRIEPSAGWDDLVLPARARESLRSFAARIRWREKVLKEWGMADGGGRGRGVAALFAGPSGTGKTMAAEVIAGALGLDLYTVSLSSVVDKFVGETEKNLERIFSEAEQVNGVLFFDEADALFGKRSEVRDAHDRYANVETAYLLQRLEKFDGIIVLATNLRANLDDAFTRRLDAVVEFPFPDPAQRRQIWERQLRPLLPRGPDVDLDFLAERFNLAGGNIRNVALGAAYLAAEAGRPVSMADLAVATHRELLNLGRLVRLADFGPHAEALS